MRCIQGYKDRGSEKDRDRDANGIETTIVTENELMIHIGLVTVRDTEVKLVIVKRMEEK